MEDRFLRIKEDLVRLFGVLDDLRDLPESLPPEDRVQHTGGGLTDLATALEERLRNFYTFDRDFKDLNRKRIEETLIHYID